LVFWLLSPIELLLVDPFVGIHAESQFWDNADSSLNLYVNPVKLTESFGIARTIIKKDKIDWSARIAAALRQNINRNSILDSLGDKGFDMTQDGGAEFVSDAVVPFKDNVTYTGRLTVYKAFFYSGAEALSGTTEENYWMMSDINFDNILALKIGSYLTVNINVQLLYDKEVDQKLRMKENLAIGLTYKFI